MHHYHPHCTNPMRPRGFSSLGLAYSSANVVLMASSWARMSSLMSDRCERLRHLGKGVYLTIEKLREVDAGDSASASRISFHTFSL